MFDKIIDEFIEKTSLIDEDEDGNEYKRQWTIKEFLRDQVVLWIIIIIGYLVINI